MHFETIQLIILYFSMFKSSTAFCWLSFVSPNGLDSLCQNRPPNVGCKWTKWILIHDTRPFGYALDYEFQFQIQFSSPHEHHVQSFMVSNGWRLTLQEPLYSWCYSISKSMYKLWFPNVFSRDLPLQSNLEDAQCILNYREWSALFLVWHASDFIHKSCRGTRYLRWSPATRCARVAPPLGSPRGADVHWKPGGMPSGAYHLGILQYDAIWTFPEIGIPPIIIHLEISIRNHPHMMRWMEEILHQLVTRTMKHCQEWNYSGINQLRVPGGGFFPSTFFFFNNHCVICRWSS